MKLSIEPLTSYIKKSAMILFGLHLYFFCEFKRFLNNFFVYLFCELKRFLNNFFFISVMIFSNITICFYNKLLGSLEYFYKKVSKLMIQSCLKTNIKSLSFNITSKPAIQSCSYVTAFFSMIVLLIIISLYLVKITILSPSIYSHPDTDYNQQRKEIYPKCKLDKNFSLYSNDNLVTQVETNKDKAGLFLYMKRNNNEITIRQEHNLKYKLLEASSINDFSVYHDTGVILENSKKVYQTNNHLTSNKKIVDFSGHPPTEIYFAQKYFNTIIAVEPEPYSIFTYDIDTWLWNHLKNDNINQKYSKILFFNDFFLRWNNHCFDIITPISDNNYQYGEEVKIDDAIVDIAYDKSNHKLFFMTNKSILEYDIHKKFYKKLFETSPLHKNFSSSQFSGNTIKGVRKYNDDLFVVTDTSLNRYIRKDRQWVHSDLKENFSTFYDFCILREKIVLIYDKGVYPCPLNFHDVSKLTYGRLDIEKKINIQKLDYQNYFFNGNELFFFDFANRIFKLHRKKGKFKISEAYNYCKNSFFQNHQVSEVQDIFHIKPPGNSCLLLTDKSILSYSPQKRCGRSVSDHYDDAIFSNNTLYYLNNKKLHVFTGENPERIKTVEKYNIESFDIYKNKTSILHSINGHTETDHNEIITYNDILKTKQHSYFINKCDISFDQLIYIYQNNNLLNFFDKEGYQSIDMQTFSATPKQKYPFTLSNNYDIKRFNETDDFLLINYNKPQNYIFCVYTNEANQLTTKTHEINTDFRVACKRGNLLVLQTQEGEDCKFLSIDKNSKDEKNRKPLYPFLKENIKDIYATHNDIIFTYKKENQNKVYKYSPHQLTGVPVDFKNITIDDSNFLNVINKDDLFGINNEKIYNISKGISVFDDDPVLDFDKHGQTYTVLLKNKNNSLVLGQNKFLDATFNQFNNRTEAYKIDNYLYMISDNKVVVIDFKSLSVKNQKDYKLIKSTLPYKKKLYLFAEEKNDSNEADTQKKLIIDCFTQEIISTVYSKESNDDIWKKNIKGYVKNDSSNVSIYHDGIHPHYEMTLLKFYESRDIQENILSIKNTAIDKIFYNKNFLYLFNKDSYAVYDTKELRWVNYGKDVAKANFINNNVWIKKDDNSTCYLDGTVIYPSNIHSAPYEYQEPYSVINQNNINFFKNIDKDISSQTMDTLFSSNELILLKQDSDVVCYTIKTRNWGIVRNDVSKLYVKQKNADIFSAYMFTQNNALFHYEFNNNGCSQKSKPHTYDQYHFSDSIVLKQSKPKFSENGTKKIHYVVLDDNLEETRRQFIPQFEMEEISNAFLMNDYFYITGSFQDENRMFAINTSIKHNNFDVTKIIWKKPEYFLFNQQLYVHDKKEKKLYRMNKAGKGKPVENEISSFSYDKKDFLFLKEGGSIKEINGEKSRIYFDYKIHQSISYYCPFGQNTLLLFGKTELYQYDYQHHTLLKKFSLDNVSSSNIINKYLFFEPKNERKYLLRLTMKKKKNSVTNAMLFYNDSKKFNPINIKLNSKDLSIRSYCVQNNKMYFLTKQGIDEYNNSSGKYIQRFKFQADFTFEFLGKNYVIMNNQVKPLNQDRQTLFTSKSDSKKIYKIESSYYFIDKVGRLYKCNGLTDNAMGRKYPGNQLICRNNMDIKINLPFSTKKLKVEYYKIEKIYIYKIHSKQYTVKNNKLFYVNLKPDTDKKINSRFYDMSDVKLKKVQSLDTDIFTKKINIRRAFDRLAIKGNTIYASSSRYKQLKYDFKNKHYFESNQVYNPQEWNERNYKIFINKKGKISVRKNNKFDPAPAALVVPINNKLLYDNMIEVGRNPLNNDSFTIDHKNQFLFHLNSMTYHFNKKYNKKYVKFYSNGDRLYVIDSDKNVFEMDKNNQLNQINISENDIRKWFQQDISFGKTISATEHLSTSKTNRLRFQNKSIELKQLINFDFIEKNNFELSAHSELIFYGEKNQLIKYFNPFSYEILERDNNNNQSKNIPPYLQKYAVTIDLKDNLLKRNISDANGLFERQKGKINQLIQKTHFEKLLKVIKLNDKTYFFTNKFIYLSKENAICIVDDKVDYSKNTKYFHNASTLLSNILIETKNPMNGRIRKFIINDKGELAKYNNESILIDLLPDTVMKLTQTSTPLIRFDNKNYRLQDISFTNNLLGLFSFTDFCYLPDKNDILFVNDSQAFQYNRDQKSFKKLKIDLNKIKKIQHSSSGIIESIHSFFDHLNHKEIVLLNNTIQFDYEKNSYTLFSVDMQNASSNLVDMSYDNNEIKSKPSVDKNFQFFKTINNKTIKTNQNFLTKLLFNSILGIKIDDFGKKQDKNRLFIFTENGTFSIDYTNQSPLDFSKIRKENDIFVKNIFKTYDYLFVQSTNDKYYQFNKGKLQPYKFQKFPGISLMVQPENITTELDSSVSFDKHDCIYFYNSKTKVKKQLHVQNFDSKSCLSINHPKNLTTFSDKTIYYYLNNEIYKFTDNRIKRFEFENIHIDDFFLKDEKIVIQHNSDFFSWDGSSNKISKLSNESEDVVKIKEELLLPKYAITNNGLGRGFDQTNNKPELVVHNQTISNFEILKPQLIFFDNDCDLNISNDLGIFKIKSQFSGHHTLLDNRISNEPVLSKKRIKDMCYVSTKSKTFLLNKPESYTWTTIPYHSIKINKGKITESISGQKKTLSLDGVYLEKLIDGKNFIFDDLENFFFDEKGNCYTYKNNFYWKQHHHTYPELIDKEGINAIIKKLPLSSFSSRDVTITVSDNIQFNVENINLQTRKTKLKNRKQFYRTDKNKRVLFKSPCQCEIFTDNFFVFDTFSHIIFSDNLYWFNESGAFTRDKWIDCNQYAKKIFGSQQFLLLEDDSTSNVRYYYPKKKRMEKYKVENIMFDDHKWKWIFQYSQTDKTSLSFENKLNKHLERYYTEQRLFKDDVVENVYIDSENVKFKTNDHKIIYFDYKQTPWKLKNMKNPDDNEILEDQHIFDDLTEYTVQSDTFLYTIPIDKNYIEVKRIQ